MASTCWPPLWVKAAAPTYGALTGRVQVGDLGDVAGHRGELAQLLVVDDAAAHLQLQRGDQRAEVGVAGALAVAVDAALHLHRAGAHRRQRVGHGAAGVVVAVDAGHRAELARSRAGSPPRSRRAGCRRWCRTAPPGAPPPQRRLEAAQRVVGVRAGTVEEVLGVEAHLAARPRPARPPTPRSCGGSRRAWCAARRAPGASQLLPTSVTTGAPESSRARSCRSSWGRTPGRRVAPNAASRACASVRAAHLREELRVGLVGAGPAALDDATPMRSRCSAMRSLSDTEKLMPTPWAPSRRVVS